LGFTPRLVFSRDGSRLAANGCNDVSFWEIRAATEPIPLPAPADVAGWLRQGRALADQGDSVGAEVAYRRASDLKDGDSSPWIEHAVILWRRGDSRSATDALDRAIGSLPDDPGHWVDLGRLLEHFGWTKGSDRVLAKARSLVDRRLSRAPDDEEAAAILAELLPHPEESGGWTILQPAEMASAAGATLTRLPDRSVLAGGLNPDVDTYTIEAVSTIAAITGLRLEALPDPSLPQFGPGRCPRNGNFVLDEIRLTTIPEPGVSVPVRLAHVAADYSQRGGLRGVAGDLDENATTAWAVWPRFGRPHWAVFETAESFATPAGTRLRVELDFRSGWPQHTLGRFRLSVTDRPFPLFEASLTRIKAEAGRNGLTRLGAACYLLGDWAPAAAVLERAAARPDSSALEGFLLALARHHLGRHDEAESDCDRALARLGSGLPDEATQVVAVEALMMIRGLGVADAESHLLDVAFPADAFAR
jgi:hypothetical protein